MKQQQKQIRPNLLDSKEISSHFSKKKELQNEMINESDKDFYHLLRWNSKRDPSDPTNLTHSYSITKIDRAAYDRYSQRGILTAPIFACTKLMVLHNPNLKPSTGEEVEVKQLSNKHKKAATELSEAGKSNEAIAQELGVDVERVNMHLN